MKKQTNTSSAKLWVICALCMSLNFLTYGSDFITLKLKGQKQGEIFGELTTKGYEKQFEVLALNHEVTSPRDAATGLATGKRQHKPLRVVLKSGRATPQLFAALVNNENITEVELTIYRTNAQNVRVRNLVIKLTNANISGITTWQPNRVDPLNSPYNTSHEVSFTYQKIDLTSPDGGTSAIDDWQAPN